MIKIKFLDFQMMVAKFIILKIDQIFLAPKLDC